MSRDHGSHTTRGPRTSGGISPTGQCGPITSSISSAPHPNQLSQRSTSPGISERHRYVHQCLDPNEHSPYCDCAATPSHRSSIPTRASPSLPPNTYNLPQHPTPRPPSVPRLGDEVWVPAPLYFGNTGHSYGPYFDGMSSAMAIQYDPYQIPEEASYPHPTTITDYQTIPIPAPFNRSYNQATLDRVPYNQAQYNQASYNQPVHIDAAQRSTLCLDLLREEDPDASRYPGPPQDAQMELDSKADIQLEEPAKPAAKQKRKRADAAQLEVLNRSYQRTKYPSKHDREYLAHELGMEPRQVQFWFQRRRQSDRQASSRQPM